jgi:hypothetical protein
MSQTSTIGGAERRVPDDDQIRRDRAATEWDHVRLGLGRGRGAFDTAPRPRQTQAPEVAIDRIHDWGRRAPRPRRRPNPARPCGDATSR